MVRPITVLTILVLISGCAGPKTQPENATSPVAKNDVLEFLIDVQERNFRKSVQFCQNRKPEMEFAFAQYLNQYRQGAQVALRQIGQQESLNLLPGDSEIEHFLALQDRQGEATLQRVITNPTYGCGKLFTIFSVFTAEDAEKKLLSNYVSYLEKRRKYCSKVPVPNGCP